MNQSKVGYVDDIMRETLDNENFRRVLFTGENMQLVVMTIQPGEDIGMEVHEEHDQFIRVEQGEGKVILNGEETSVQDDYAIVIPAGAEHNVVNASESVPLKLYTLYAPPEHPKGTVHKTREEAVAAEK